MTIISFVAAWMMASATEAQSPTPEDRARIQALYAADPYWHSRSAWMGFRWGATFGQDAGGVWIYSAPTREGAPAGRPTRPRFVARKIALGPGKAGVSEWANTDECPALMEVVRGYERLETPRIVVFDLHWPATLPPIVVDGTAWTIWTRGSLQPDGYSADVTMTSNAGMIEQWGRKARDDLDACWTPNEPAEDF